MEAIKCVKCGEENKDEAVNCIKCECPLPYTQDYYESRWPVFKKIRELSETHGVSQEEIMRAFIVAKEENER